MIRDKKQEKRVRIVAWLTWKGEGLMRFLMVLVYSAMFISETMGWYNFNLEEKPSFLDWIMVLVTNGFFIALVWWLGKSLVRLKSWAWWLTIINLVANLPLIILAGLLTPLIGALFEKQSQIAMMLWGLFVFFGLVTMVYCLWVLLSRRGRRIFTDEYRNRLKHGSFRAFEVTYTK